MSLLATIAMIDPECASLLAAFVCDDRRELDWRRVRQGILELIQEVVASIPAGVSKAA